MTCGAVLLVCVLGGFVGAAPEPAPAPRPVVGREQEDPSPEIAALVKRVRAGDPVAAKKLGQLPEAEPYLRFAILLAPDKRLTAALAELHASNDARNVARAKKWAAAGRINLLVEAVCLAHSDAAANALTAHLYDIAKLTAECASELLTGKKDKRAARPRGVVVRRVRQRHRGAPVRRCEGGSRPAERNAVVARSGGCLSTVGEHWFSVSVVRDGWTTHAKFPNKLYASLLFMNGDLALGDVERRLVVTDGDVTRWQRADDSAEVSGSVVIARVCERPGGDRRLVKQVVRLGRREHHPQQDGLGRRLGILAGGDIQAEAKKGYEPALVKGKTTDNPFGVRFFETRDVGVEVEDHADGVRIKSLTPDSPLAVQGLRVGDVVFRVNDTATETAKEFRRELRRAVVWEAGVFWLAGDGKRLTRVVRFPDAIK